MKPMIQYLILAGLLSFLPAIAVSEDTGQPGVENEKRFEAVSERLNLTTEQKEKLKTLRQNQRQQMKELLQALRTKRQQIKDELNNPGATRESIAPLAAEIKTLLARIVDQRIEGVFVVKEMLTPEQFNLLKEARAKKTGGEKGCRPFWLGKRRTGITTDQESESGMHATE